MTYWLIATFFNLYIRAVVGVRVSGRENVPREGAVVLCANHRSWWDIPAVGSLLGRRVHFMAKEELFHYPGFGALIRKLGAFPVHRGEADRTALRRTLTLLAAGEAVAIFPEGHRSSSGRLGQARAGAAFVATRAGAPIVPIGIRGTYRRGGGLRFQIGAPIQLGGADAPRRRACDLEVISQTVVMGRIAALISEDGGESDDARGQPLVGHPASAAPGRDRPPGRGGRVEAAEDPSPRTG